MRALQAQPAQPADRRPLVLPGVRALDHQQHGRGLSDADARELGRGGADERQVAGGEGALEAGVGRAG